MVAIYQIQYSNSVVGGFDSDFIKYDCRKSPENEKREIAHMQRLFREYKWNKDGDQYLGLFSPKFNDKSGLSGKEFIHWIKSNPGYDVYFINPFPQLEYFHYNVWEQGEYWHPGLKELADSLFKAANLDIQTQSLPKNNIDTLLYSNYWVGNRRFWEEYMRFIDKLMVAIDGLESIDRKRFFSQTLHYTPATFFPFIFERMFSTFLCIQKNLKSLSYSYEKDKVINKCSNDFERLIVADWSNMIANWDSHGHSELEVRDFFHNLENLQRMFTAL